MFILKKLFRSKEKIIEDNKSLESNSSINPVECPSCHSQKVGIQFSHSNKGSSVESSSKEQGDCRIIESGTMKKFCQICKYVWDEEKFDTPAYLMMKPK